MRPQQALFAGAPNLSVRTFSLLTWTDRILRYAD